MCGDRNWCSDLSAVAQRAKAEAIRAAPEQWIASSLSLLANDGGGYPPRIGGIST
jgi:hypothetical protein